MVMKPYSLDLRQRVIAACDENQSTKIVARRFGVSPAWVRRLKQHRRERGDILPRQGGGAPVRKIDRERLTELVIERPDATLVELRDLLGITVTPWAICKALQQLKLTYKKSRSTPASRIGRISRRPEQPGV
jgi:transposase